MSARRGTRRADIKTESAEVRKRGLSFSFRIAIAYSKSKLLTQYPLENTQNFLYW